MPCIVLLQRTNTDMMQLLSTKFTLGLLLLSKNRNRKSICLVDATGQNRALPGLKRQSRTYEDDEMDLNIPWKVGFSETSGIRNKYVYRIRWT